jgi:uncharacterized protein YraI
MELLELPMKWAALSLLALSALSVPTVLQAQDNAFTLDFAKTALKGFGEDLLRRSRCFSHRQDVRPLRIAVAQIEDSTRFDDYEADTISDRIEEALAHDSSFQVIERRRRWEIEEIRKALGERKSSTPQDPHDQLEGIVTIRPEAARAVSVVAYGYTDTLCVGTTKYIPIGRIDKAPDVPRKFFERAARKLPDKSLERLVVMPPDITSFATGMAARIMAQRLQEQLVDAIRNVLRSPARTGLHQALPPVVQAYIEGVNVSGAWRANLRLRPSQRGIDARIEFLPGDQSPPISDTAYFARDVLPADSDPEVVAAVDGVCRNVRQELDALLDPDQVQALYRKDECPRMRDELQRKERSLREAALARIPSPPVPPTTPDRFDTPDVSRCTVRKGDYVIIGVRYGDTDNGLLLRSGPSTGADTVGRIPPNGTGIVVESCSGSFCRVQYGCLSGWAGRRYLSESSAETMRVVGVSPDDHLNIRIGPGSSYQESAHIPYNATAVIRHVCQPSPTDQTQWCLVTYNNESGWAAGRYLSR